MHSSNPIVPSDIRAESSAGHLLIAWSDGSAHQYPFVFLRGQCQCARCVDEITGRLLLDLSSIPQDLCVKSMDLRGNYAICIVWSDGHDTGLYTWEFLRELTQKDEVIACNES